MSDRDRALLDLHLRHGLEGAELGEAMGISTGHAYVLLTRLRGQLERSLGALLIARLGRRDCAELAELLKSWDGSFSPLVRKRIARHVDRCRTCGERRRRAVSPVALLTAVPLIPAPVYLRELVLDRVDLVAHHGPAEPPESRPAEPPGSGPALPPGSGAAGPPRSGPAKQSAPRRRRLVGAGAVLVVLAGAGAGLWAGTRTSPELDGGVGAGPSSTPGVQSPAVVVPESSPDPAVPPVPVPVPSEPEPAIAPPSGLPLPPRPEAPAPQTTIRPVPSPPKPVDISGPVIVRLDASPTRVGLPGCAQDRAAVRAEVTDDSGVESVILNWTNPDGRIGIIELTPTATSWHGRLGPFTQPGRVRWRLVATDTVGNTTLGPPTNLPVISCATPTPTPVPVPEENS